MSLCCSSKEADIYKRDGLKRDVLEDNEFFKVVSGLNRLEMLTTITKGVQVRVFTFSNNVKENI
jgi:hypothetical protein